MEILDLSQLSVSLLVLIFIVTAAIITYVGYYLSLYADQLADRTGIGEAATGAILLGAVTSLSGIMTSVVAAIQLDAALAVSNSIGGIVAQTVFLAVADLTYRKANLEHAAASISNIMYGMILVILLMELLFLSVVPPLEIWGFHPGILLVPATYIFGLNLASSAEKTPMWRPRNTKDTVLDVPKEKNKQKSLSALLIKFAISALIISGCGYVVAKAGMGISVQTGLSSSFVGALFTATSTSLPELVVTVMAVRHGALTLAVGNVLGGNTFDVLIVPLTDIFYRGGSILHYSSVGSQLIIVMASFMTSILLLGLLDRERHGFGNIGWESFSVILSFFIGYAILFYS